MKHKEFHILVTIMLIVSLASGGMCSFVSSLAHEKTCHMNGVPKKGIGVVPSGTCKVYPCKVADRTVYIIPDTSTRIVSESKTRSMGKETFALTNVTATAALPFACPIKDVLKFPLSYNFPSLYALHCVYIC